MYVVTHADAVQHSSSTSCTVYEYIIPEKDINGALVHIRGRYPETGWVMNRICKEMVYVISGTGKVVVEGKEIALSKKMVILILPGEKYYWEGDMELFMPCTPAWTPDQYVQISSTQPTKRDS